MVRLKVAFAAYSEEKDVDGLVRIETSHASGYWTVVNVTQMEKRKKRLKKLVLLSTQPAIQAGWRAKVDGAQNEAGCVVTGCERCDGGGEENGGL